jgi:hypothetical protein
MDREPEIRRAAPLNDPHPAVQLNYERRFPVIAPERTMRIMKYSLIVSVLLFIIVTIQIPSKAAHPPQHSLELIIGAMAFLDVALAYAARPFLSRFAKATAGGTGNALLNQWMSANVVSLAMIESSAMFAIVLHVLGSATILVGLLFGCALLALVVWTPGTPPVPEGVPDPSRQIQRF